MGLTIFFRVIRVRQLVVLACATIVACESLTEVVARETYAADLRGTSVRPDTVSTTGTGSFHATLSSDTSAMTYDLTYSGLSSAATAIHIHGPAADSVVVTPLVDLAALPAGGTGSVQLGTSGSASGSIDLARAVTPGVSGDSLRRLLIARLLYVDVHTQLHSGGEIRGQIGR